MENNEKFYTFTEEEIGEVMDILARLNIAHEWKSSTDALRGIAIDGAKVFQKTLKILDSQDNLL